MDTDQQAIDTSKLEIRWSPGLIVTSYVVSAAGAWVALELVRLRTSNRGWFNWLLLLLASFVTGGLAIFSMHVSIAVIGTGFLTAPKVKDKVDSLPALP